MAKKEINLGNYVVNENSFPYLIAEIGINHNGDLNIAKKLIDAANACGWDCVKFQKRTPDIAVPEAQKSVLRDTPWGQMTYLEYKKKIEFEKMEYDYIDKYCAEKPIAWTASPWDIPSTEFLLEYDIPFLKVASATNSNFDILKLACESKKPLLVSTGMSTIEELDVTVDFLNTYSDGNFILSVLRRRCGFEKPLRKLCKVGGIPAVSLRERLIDLFLLWRLGITANLRIGSCG